jgi:hypothetical protein
MSVESGRAISTPIAVIAPERRRKPPAGLPDRDELSGFSSLTSLLRSSRLTTNFTDAGEKPVTFAISLREIPGFRRIAFKTNRSLAWRNADFRSTPEVVNVTDGMVGRLPSAYSLPRFRFYHSSRRPIRKLRSKGWSPVEAPFTPPMLEITPTAAACEMFVAGLL